MEKTMVAEAHRVFPVETHPKGPWPLLIGLQGPPGSGKSLSSLRLARGIQSVRPGPIRVIDTEAGRSAAYRADIEFGLVRLDPPYRPTRFLAAIQELIRLDAPACIIVDSLSDFWDGTGGILEWHEQEVSRRVGKGNEENWARRDAVSMAAWIVPKADLNRFGGGVLRITTPIIFTFRAREKTRPIRDPATGKTVPTKLGYIAIAPAEICHAMTAMCLLPPHADGRPIWKSEEVGQDFLLKRPNFLREILTEAQLDETTGAKLATWAQGTALPAMPAAVPVAEPVVDVEEVLTVAAQRGVEVFRETWKGMTKAQTRHIPKERLDMLAAIAREADARHPSTGDTPTPPPASP